jgi:hypothetical protein
MKQILILSVASLLAFTLSARASFAQDAAPDDASAPPAGPPPQGAPPPPPGYEQPQNVRAPNSIYAEGLGAGLFYSINYERLLTEDIGLRGGFGYLSETARAQSINANGTTTVSESASASILTIPVTVSYIGVRGRTSALEVGGGATFVHFSGSTSGFGANSTGASSTAFGIAMVGYRLHPVDGAGFQLRVGGMVVAGKGLSLSGDGTAFGAIPWLYLSLGASF